MDESTRVLIILILIIILLLAVAFLGSNLMMRRALRTVIKMFRNGQARTPETAQYAEDLGIKRRTLLQFKALRDYKPTALQLLMRGEIILSTEEGKLYLNEERLAQTSVEQKIGSK